MNHAQDRSSTISRLSRRNVLRGAALAGIAVTGGIGRQLIQVTEAYAAEVPVALAQTVLIDQLSWFLGTVNASGAGLNEEVIAEHFAPSLLAVIPPAQIGGLVQALGGGFGTLALQGTTRPQTETQAVALVSTAVGVQLALPISIEAGDAHRITGLTLYPSPSGNGTPLLPADDEGHPLPTAMVTDIGGRGLYFAGSGVGGPTVIFEAGLTDSAATWAGVVPAIAAVTRVFSYDRANTTAGASDPAPMPRTAANAVADLHNLLIATETPGPYVLVGHSVGGVFARLYASTYTDEVVGLVLVDASHEDQDLRRQAMVSPELFAAEQQAVGANSEGIDLGSSFTQVRDARVSTPLAPMPLVVLSAGLNDPSFFPMDWPMEAEAALHHELQSGLAKLVPGGRHVIAEQSGHYIQQTQPDLVVAAILDVVRAVGDPSSWETN